jgi:hypothetical protein
MSLKCRSSVATAWLLFGWIGVVAVIYLSLTPSPLELNLGRFTDKWQHLAAYAVLMLWFSQLRTALGERIRIAVCLAGLGIGLEFLQQATGLRNFDTNDMVANALGVCFGWLLAPPRLPNVLILTGFASTESQL